MRTLSATTRRLAYGAITAGILIGIASYVRISALIIAVGTGLIALDNRSSRKIEMYLPLAIAIALFLLAIALPGGL